MWQREPIAFCYGWNVQDSAFGADQILSSGGLGKLVYETPPLSLSVYPLIYSSTMFLLLLVDYANLQGLFTSSRLWIYMSQDEWPHRRQPRMETWNAVFTRFTTLLGSSRTNPTETQSFGKSKSWRQTREQPAQMNFPEVNPILRGRLVFMKLVVLGLFIYFMTVYIHALFIFRGPAYKVGWANLVGIPLELSDWTFGQLVAITVWLPSLMQYAYLELCKSA